MESIHPPAHWGKRFAGQTLEWLPTDTKEIYEKLCQDSVKMDYFISKGWDRAGAITYQLNSHGFRCDEFEGGPYVLTLGCSFTIGIGLPVECTWPYLVGQALNLRVANLAWGGYSNDTCFRLAEYWIPRLKPDCVMMLSPPGKRLELFIDQTSNREFEVFLPQSESKLMIIDEFLKHWFLNDLNSDVNHRKNKLALRQLCSDYNTPCVILDSLGAVNWSENCDIARDFLHPGPANNRYLADQMIKLLGTVKRQRTNADHISR